MWISNRMPISIHQKIFWLTKSDKFYFYPRTNIPYSRHTTEGNKGHLIFNNYKKKSKEFSKHIEGIWLHDFIEITKETKRTNQNHVLRKPQKLIRILLNCFCMKPGLVLDCFSGEGTIPLVCKQKGFDFIAIEKNHNLVNIINKKLEQKNINTYT